MSRTNRRTRWTLPRMALAILFVPLAGCAASDPLEGKAWILEAFAESAVLEGTIVTAAFSAGQIRGSSGCNSYSGSYAIEADRIELGDLAWTLMACPDPEGVMEQEAEVMALLARARSFELGGGLLHIRTEDGQELVFVPSP